MGSARGWCRSTSSTNFLGTTGGVSQRFPRALTRAVHIRIHILRTMTVLLQRLHTSSHRTRNHQETSVPNHVVVWPDGKALCLPGALHQLVYLGLCPAILRPELLAQPAHLRCCCHIARHHSTRLQNSPCLAGVVPRVQQVENQAIVRMLVEARCHLVETADLDIPLAGRFSKVQLDVGRRNFCKLRAFLNGRHMPGLAHCVNQRQTHRTRAAARLHHAHTRANIAVHERERNILGVHNLCAARHGELIIHQPGAQAQVLPAADSLRILTRFLARTPDFAHRSDDGTWHLADNIVVANQAVAGFRHLSAGQLNRHFFGFFIAQLYLFAGLKCTRHSSLL